MYVLSLSPPLSLRMSLNVQYLIVVLITFLCVTVLIFLLYFLLFALAGLPIFTYTSATFSPLIYASSSPSLPSPSSNLTFSVRKPYNKLQHLYGPLNVSIFHTCRLIFEGSSGSVSNFSQGPEEPSTIPLVAVEVQLTKAVAWDLIHDLERDGRNVSLGVRVAGRVSFGWVLHRTHVIRALCRDVPVGFASNASEGVLLAMLVCESRLCDSGPNAGDPSCLNSVIPG